MVRQIGLADSDLSHVDRAIGWIRDNYAEPVRIEDLARLSGMSASGISPALPRRHGHEPVAIPEADPLQQARSLLVANPGDVAGIGHRVGYDSPSQFNREYRRLFGIPPGQHAEPAADRRRVQCGLRYLPDQAVTFVTVAEPLLARLAILP